MPLSLSMHKQGLYNAQWAASVAMQAEVVSHLDDTPP